MNELFLIETIGYLASVLIAVGMLMKTLKKLRVICCAGSALFCLYGILIGSIPVAFLNFFIAGINLFYLWKMYKKKKS